MSVYNGETFLREAVESILNQTFREFEFIIVNDGSTDGSVAMLDSYQINDKRLKVYHQENKGLIESLNRGCVLARGKYIARMDADDIALRDRLTRQIDFMETHLEVGVVGSAIETINTLGDTVSREYYPVTDQEIKLFLRRGTCSLVHPTVLIRKNVFDASGGYRKVVVDAEDFDLWLRIADFGKFANIKMPLLKYRRHLGQVSVRKFRQQVLSNIAASVSSNIKCRI